MLRARVLELPPDPIALGRALAERPGLVIAWDAGPLGRSWLACDPVAEQHGVFDPEPELRLEPGPSELSQAPRWFGLLPYEAFRSVERSGRPPATDVRPAPHVEDCLWLRYGAVAEVGPWGVRVIGDDEAAIDTLCQRLRRPPVMGAAELIAREPEEPAAVHVARIERALEWIAQGQLYQVNLARLFQLSLRGSALELLARIGARTRAAYGFALQIGELQVVSTSPELFLRVTADGRVKTSPIKGTRPRGRDAIEDRALVIELESDPKERAELTMVVDVERNDLSRICVSGSVVLSGGYATNTHPTLHHRVAHVHGRLRPEVTRQQLFAATMPSGSVTGAPKLRAMEAIAELEAARRGLYTGAFGVLRHDGGLELGMAIRTLTARGERAHYFAGGGIVADSDPAREVEETLWKARQIAETAQNWPARGKGR
ncbi:MAG: anthranilate synthase component I family protein [Polyangiaceae bacterium]